MLFLSKISRQCLAKLVGRSKCIQYTPLVQFSQTVGMTSSKRLLVDCDVGLDDAQALIMALARTDVTIDAITAVSGNTDVENAARNVRKVLQLCGRLSIPTYRGCTEPLVVHDREEFKAYHGIDGLGDVTDDTVTNDDVIQDQHAVPFLIEAATKDPKTYSLVCLGPLTNIATALKLDPNFGQNLKACYIMGGNYHARGNVTATAEFNFHFDPEAAYIVLRSLKCPITLVGWEACLDHPITYDAYERLYRGEGRARKFIRLREMNGVEWMKEAQYMDYVFADQLAMAVVLDHDVVTKSFVAMATVELHGAMTRGQMVVDRTLKDSNIEIVVDLDKERIVSMLADAMDKFE